MENKKQLLIIPPMSEPLQKLKEVLEGIATDENIEISIIDDLKELTQFVGSSGQCLIAFSNAKKCATFLQENRFVVAKTHSKVILLTPKEIPAKTLIKFTKIGLTESILENSPPKTLLYKVKLLLRSIKSTGGTEEKELAVKSIDAGAAKEAQAKGEMNADKLQGEEGSVNYLAEERAKFKKGDADSAESVNYMDNLKGKTTAQEETIDTHWKSKRKKDDPLSVDAEADVSKVETEEAADIDMYYRGKKKSNDLDIIATDEIKTRKKSEQLPEEEDLVEKTSKSFDLDLAPGEPEKRKQLLEEEETSYKLKQSRADEDLPFLEEEEKKRPQLSEEEEEEERKRQELMELESLFEEAKKRQKAQEAEDLGGHYKGKISNTQMDLEEPEETQEREDYDNSDLYTKEKSLDLDLAPGDEEKLRRREEEEDEEEKKERDGFGEKLGGNLESEEGQTDHIETMMKSDMGSDRSKKIQTHDIHERKRTKEEDAPESEAESRELDLAEETAPEERLRKKQHKEEVEEQAEANSIDLDLAAADSSDKKKEKLSDEEESFAEREKQTHLKLVDGDRDSDRDKSKQEESDHMSFRKLDSTDLGIDDKKDKAGTGKTDKIDTFYRSGESKKKDQDWDLGEKRNNLDLGLEKKGKRGPDTTQKKEDTDLGEQTIDYRRMKEEFEAMARGDEFTGEESGPGGPGGRKSSEDEDASFKVVEPQAAGFDFAIEILNMIYQKELKPDEFYKAISEELHKTYRAFPVFYSYKPTDKKHNEVFDSILKVSTDDNLKMWWLEHKKDEALFSDVQTKTMATWVCREMNWEDVELPTWAANELTTKKVELIYPFFDGVDRMGLAVLYFPEGINPKLVRGIEVTVEMARTLLLDTIQRKTSAASSREEEKSEEENSSEKKNILSVFSGLFKGKKAG